MIRTLILTSIALLFASIPLSGAWAGAQGKARAFYDIGNLVSIQVTMDEQAWQALLTDQPKGGQCNFDYDEVKEGPRYAWRTIQSMTITGSHAPSEPLTLTHVKIRKKSFCGSFSLRKPSLKFKIADKSAKKSIGIHNLILNNSRQDELFVRQCLGYKLIAQARLPAPHCNMASVTVNGQKYGAFVNLEAFKKPYVKRNFNGNAKGNLYELIYTKDLLAETNPDFFGFKGYSDNTSRSDLKQVIVALDKGDITELGKLIDLDEFTRFWAMEILLNEIDGYTNSANNTYIYNDIDLSDPANKDKVNLKFSLWGIDRILGSGAMSIYHEGKIASLLYNKPSSLARLKTRLTTYADSIFGPDNLDNNIFPYLDRLTAQAHAAGAAKPLPADISGLKTQLKVQIPEGIKLLVK